ncbi:MAG TPA: DUF4139 domain-containing protein [Bacteroidia bacterium]|nr:DUF4139 domain-containing protein [Bacteroidia bacterium]HRS58848.1 DUF4139 domain-containing protein [Bacteroidia bacterium]HRU67720.1 DUF4139 domain-containing protein [Bacteroidia bacterium]
MKNVILISMLALICSFSGNAEEKKVSSKITTVTIYQQNAKITRTASVTLPAGSSVIVFQGLETMIQTPSIQVKMSREVRLLSAGFQLNYLQDKKNSAEYAVLADSLDLLKYQIGWIDEQIVVLDGEARLISENQKLGGSQQGVTVNELKALALWYSQRMGEIRKSIFDLKKKKDDLNKIKSRIQNQLNNMNAVKTTTTGEILVEVTASAAVTAEFEISYIVTGVNWVPLYDIRSEGTDKPVRLVYKASVTQMTGVEWKNVQIRISTGNPNANNSRPVLNPRYLYVYQPTLYETKAVTAAKPSAKNMYAEEAAPAEDLKRAEAASPDYNYVTMDVVENQLNIEFKVEEAYTIPSDGKPHLVTMTEFEIPAIYEYHTVPILDNGAFLLAKLTDWGKYNLLPGNANIFFENNYIGQSYINPKVTYDTLLLSFGRDEKIVVTREKVFKESSVNTSLGTTKHVNVYEITIRNTKSKAITIDLLDQIPLSNMKDVIVELIDRGNAEYSDKIGKLSWLLTIQPNETKKIRFSYSVKHPKDLIVEGI